MKMNSARLIVDGVLSNGFSNTLPNRLIKRVAGDVSLGAVSLDLWPVPTMAKLVGVGGSAADSATWSVTGGAGAGNASVSLRTDGYWITRAGSVIYIR